MALGPSRVVVTGIGAVTSIGTGRRQLWEAFLSGQSGISAVESFDSSRYPVHRGGEIKQFVPSQFVRRLSPAAVGRAAALAIAAARLALEDAGLAPDGADLQRAGVALGTTSGEPQLVEWFNDCETTERRDRIGQEFIGQYPCNRLATSVAGELRFGGSVTVIPTACAAGNYAVAAAFDALRADETDLMLAGGADAFSRITYAGFARLGAIAPDVCRPFDRNRRGMIPGEGAAVLVLETLERALARGALIYAEVAGYGLSCDATHMTMPQAGGAARAMEQALASTGIRPSEIDYISAHGTGTAANDRVETAAVKQVFGDAARHVPMSSVKSMIGHTMGAASAIEAAVCALAVRSDRIPPTINLDTPDPECDLDYVANASRAHVVQAAMNNAYAFGGHNATVIFTKYDERRVPQTARGTDR